MDFQERLAKAIERGQHLSHQEAQAKHKQTLTEEDLRRLHSKYRLPLTERIESCLKRLPDHMRDAVEMVYARGMLMAAVARALDATEEAVKKRVQRARQMLAECVGGGEGRS